MVDNAASVKMLWVFSFFVAKVAELWYYEIVGGAIWDMML